MKALQHKIPIAIRTVDISNPMVAIDDLSQYPACRIFVFLGRRLLGKVDIINTRESISPARLRDAISDQLNNKLASLFMVNHDDMLEEHMSAKGSSARAATLPRLPASVSVSIALATYDRPDQLRQSLRAIYKQESSREIEIVVVDNHPTSGLTPPVVSEFPEAVLVSEHRQGLAYARNAGFVHSSGEILVATDDDVIMPPDWIEQLVSPFVRSEVAVVTGNVLPRELETKAQYFFEEYGGLGRGFDVIEAGPSWLRDLGNHAAPTWKLGATANAAFRAEVFRDPQVGLMDEALGPGMPSGVGEDTYLFYKILKAGYTLIYQPDAYVWHTHRREIKALRSQLYNYSKGHVSYHLTTLLRDGDRRAISYLLFRLPYWNLKRIKSTLRGRKRYPISLILLEIWGYMMGPFALWRSRQRVRREGRSELPAGTEHPVSDVE